MQRRLAGCLLGVSLLATACSMGPQYQKPIMPLPSSFKEANAWKMAQPSDAALRGKWWEIFQDPLLNVLEEQVDVSNQNLAAAAAQFRGARAAIRIAQAPLFPTLTGRIGISGLQQSANRSTGNQNSSSQARADYQLPLDVSYELDVWGRIRHTVEANVATAQASAADLETLRLMLHAEVAMQYFALRGVDAQKALLDLTTSAYEKALELTTNRYNQGVVSQQEVLQARTQLEATRSQAIDLGVQRTQLEHAIALLLGKTPGELSIDPTPAMIQPPDIPLGIPSELLERRPDIAAAERRVATANAQIGIARAAFYPTMTLTGTLGLESSQLGNLVSWPSVLWSIGSSLAQVAFDAGRRQAVTEQAQASYEATVAMYRQTVLTAFQNVEDNLAALRILEEEAQQQERTVQVAERSLLLALNRYKGGVTTYLEVITAQSAALAAARAAVDITTRRMTASVLLIKALGGGWEGLSG